MVTKPKVIDSPYTRGRHLKEAIFGTPSKEQDIKKTKTLILGAVEQSYGIYQIPSFRDQVTTFWNDPLIKESVTMFGEKVCSTGFYLTANKEYKDKLPINGHEGTFTALEVIKMWCDLNNIDIKILDIAIEMKAFGNSFWTISGLGFVKIPIEAVWHMVRVDPLIPLQDKYHVQLMPIYGGRIVHWGEFMHFRVGVTGYHAPLGQGVLYSLLMHPIDSEGKQCPSIYDIRLGMRASLNEGFRKFSFSNVWIGVPNMSNEDFEAKDKGGKTLGERVRDMSSTGNRVITNSDIKVELEVPERTQSYDMFIKQMNDEFFMSLADPSLKLGLEQGFTKATAESATDEHQFKISTMRRTIKQQFEDLFKQILAKLGFDPIAANVQMNFGPEESATYEIKEIWDAVKNKVILPNEARELLKKYRKWDINGDIEGGNKPLEQKSPFGDKGRPEVGKEPKEAEKDKEYKEAATQKRLKEAIEFMEVSNKPRDINLNVNVKAEELKMQPLTIKVETEPQKLEITTKPLEVNLKSEATVNVEPVKTEITVKSEPVKAEVTVKAEKQVIEVKPIKSEVTIKNEPLKVEVEVKESEDKKLSEKQRLSLLKKAVTKLEER